MSRPKIAEIVTEALESAKQVNIRATEKDKRLNEAWQRYDAEVVRRGGTSTTEPPDEIAAAHARLEHERERGLRDIFEPAAAAIDADLRARVERIGLKYTELAAEMQGLEDVERQRAQLAFVCRQPGRPEMADRDISQACAEWRARCHRILNPPAPPMARQQHREPARVDLAGVF